MILSALFLVGCADEAPVAKVGTPAQFEHESAAPMPMTGNSNTVEVVLDGQRAEPEVVNLMVGDAVLFVAADGNDHRIVGDTFYSGNMMIDSDVYSVAFNEVGEFGYIDSETGATGKIIVN